MHCPGVNSYLFVNGVEIYKFKAKDSEINAAPLSLGNVSKDISADNMRKSELFGYSYNILDIHKYLMVRNDRKFKIN